MLSINMKRCQTMIPDLPDQHNVFRSALLHLGPGIVALLGYLFVTAPLSTAFGLPTRMAFILMDVLVLIPVLLGLLLYVGHSKNGRWTLDGIVLNRHKLPAKKLAAILFALFCWGALVMAFLYWTDAMLLKRVFYWVPDSLLNLEKVDLTAYPPILLIGTRLASAAIVALIGPIAEELYFRGFLLPRVSWMGPWAAIWQAFLFAGYHFWSPWSFIWRVILLIPAIYAVQRTRSISVMIWGHCLKIGDVEIRGRYPIIPF